MFGRNRKSNLAARIVDERLHDTIAAEINGGVKKEGLWLKALANSRGNEERAFGVYIKLRLQSLKDELEFASMQDENRNQDQAVITTSGADRLAGTISKMESAGCTVIKRPVGWRVRDPRGKWTHCDNFYDLESIASTLDCPLDTSHNK